MLHHIACHTRMVLLGWPFVEELTHPWVLRLLSLVLLKEGQHLVMVDNLRNYNMIVDI